MHLSGLAWVDLQQSKTSTPGVMALAEACSQPNLGNDGRAATAHAEYAAGGAVVPAATTATEPAAAATCRAVPQRRCRAAVLPAAAVWCPARPQQVFCGPGVPAAHRELPGTAAPAVSAAGCTGHTHLHAGAMGMWAACAARQVSACYTVAVDLSVMHLWCASSLRNNLWQGKTFMSIQQPSAC